MSATVLPPNASRSTPHTRRDTASHQRPICQRADGARSRRTAPLFQYVTEPGNLFEQINLFLPARRRPNVDHSLVAGGARRQVASVVPA